MHSRLAAFEREYLEFVTHGEVGAEQLFQLGGLAYDIFVESRGVHSLLAYVLRSVFLDLAERLNGEPVSPDLGRFLKTLNGPVEAAIAGLKRPLSEIAATRLAIELLDGRRSFLT
jgi:hypothetical protein